MWKIISRIKSLFKRKTKKEAPSFVEHYYTPEQCLFGPEEYRKHISSDCMFCSRICEERRTALDEYFKTIEDYGKKER